MKVIVRMYKIDQQRTEQALALVEEFRISFSDQGEFTNWMLKKAFQHPDKFFAFEEHKPEQDFIELGTRAR